MHDAMTHGKQAAARFTKYSTGFVNRADIIIKKRVNSNIELTDLFLCRILEACIA